CLRVGDVLLLEDAGGEGVFVISIEHRDRLLHDDGPVIEMLVDEVYRAPRDLHAVFNRLLLRFEPRKRRQQRWMDVEDTIWELLTEPGRQQSHVSGHADQVHPLFLEGRHNFAVVFFALLPFRRHHARIQAALPRDFDSWSVGAIGNNYRNSRTGYAARIDVVRDRHKVRPASGEQDAQIFY